MRCTFHVESYKKYVIYTSIVRFFLNRVIIARCRISAARQRQQSQQAAQFYSFNVVNSSMITKLLLISVCIFCAAFHAVVSFAPPLPKQPQRRLHESAKNHQHAHHPPKEGRRVLKLIGHIKESLVQQDFSRPLWDAIKYEASSIAEGDLKAGSLMSNFILSQPNFEDAVIDFVANQLETSLFPATQIRNLFAEMCLVNPQMSSIWALDLMAAAMRDKSQANAVSVLLFNKGFHSLVTYRVAHELWYGGRDGMARYFQSLTSRTFGSDIHPASKIGVGCVISSGTGIVIGETAVLGNDCMLSHDVTLGGTGKESGDRHPKLGNGVFVGAGATILGKIAVGDGAVINSGSVVTKAIAAFTRVGGVPAKTISVFTPQDDNFAIAQMAYHVDDLLDPATKEIDLPKLYLDYHKQNGIR